jgi:predicted nucleotidyltransferase
VPDTAPPSRTVETLPDDWEVARLARILREHLPDLRERYGISSLELFGSYVRNEQHQDSDLDVLVGYQRAPSLLGLIALQDHLSDLLGVRVDLTMRSGLRPGIRRYLLTDTIAV